MVAGRLVALQMMALQTLQMHLLAETHFCFAFLFVVDQLLFGVRVGVVRIVDANMVVLVVLIVGRQSGLVLDVVLMMVTRVCGGIHAGAT